MYFFQRTIFCLEMGTGVGRRASTNVNPSSFFLITIFFFFNFITPYSNYNHRIEGEKNKTEQNLVKCTYILKMCLIFTNFILFQSCSYGLWYIAYGQSICMFVCPSVSKF